MRIFPCVFLFVFSIASLIDHVTLLLPTTNTKEYIYPAVPSGNDNQTESYTILTGVVQFPLKAHGCFHWGLSSYTEIISIKQVMLPDSNVVCEDGTSNGVYVIPNVPTSFFEDRQSTFVEARINPNDEKAAARCEVFVDQIHRLEVVTRTRRVQVNDSESVEIQAFDSQDNMFSSLEGMLFEWTNSAPEILEQVPFKDAGVNVTKFIRDAEKAGLLTHRIAVQGRTFGKANLTANLLDPSNTIVNATTVNLTVITKLRMIPRGVLLPTHATVAFQLEASKKKQWVSVALDDPQSPYRWSTKKKDILAIDPRLGIATALRPGKSLVIVEHQNFTDNNQKELVTVCDPHRLLLHLRPVTTSRSNPFCSSSFKQRPLCNGNWVISKDTDYFLDIALCCQHEPSPPDASSLIYDIRLQGQSVRLIEGIADGGSDTVGRTNRVSSGNGVVSVKITGINLGKTQIFVELKGVEGSVYHPFRTPLAVTGSILITPPLEISHPTVVLPIPPPFLLEQLNSSFVFKSAGGSGEESWHSSNESVITVDLKGRVAVYGGGHSIVSVQDNCNPENQNVSLVTVSSPGSLEFLPGPKEIQVKEIGKVVVGIRDTEGRKFSYCSSLVLHLKAYQDTLTFVNSPTDLLCQSDCPSHKGYSCWILQIQARSVGFAEVRAALHPQVLPTNIAARSPDPSLTGFDVWNCTEMAAFEPLILNHNAVFLSEGSSFDLTWERGPLPWPATGFECAGGASRIEERSSSLHRLYQDTEETVLKSKIITSWPVALKAASLPLTHANQPQSGQLEDEFTDVHFYSLICLDHAEKAVDVELAVMNQPVPSNPEPFQVRATVKVHCFPPLRVEPRILRLGVGAQLAVSVIPPSHPLAPNVTWVIDQPDVARVSAKGIVTGVTLGETLLHAKMVHPSLVGVPPEKDGLHDIVKVIVQFEGFVIKLRTCDILQGQETSAYVEGRNGEVPGDPSFSFVHCQWSSSSPAIQILPFLSNPNAIAVENAVDIHGCSVRLFARHPAQNVMLKVKVFVAQDITTIERSVTVLEPLELLSPSFLLLPPGASSFITTNPDPIKTKLEFSVLKPQESLGSSLSSSLHVDNHGLIRAGQIEEDGVILIRSVNDTTHNCAAHDSPPAIRQSLSVRVEVRSVEQLSVSPLNSLVLGPICIGNEVIMQVFLRDAVGRIFSSLDGWAKKDGGAAAVLGFSCNRPELLRVQKKNRDEAGEKTNSTVTLISLTALPPLTPSQSSSAYTPVVIKLWAVNQPDILPVFLPVEIVEQCVSPASVRVKMWFISNALNDFPFYNPKDRRDLEVGFATDVALALKIPINRILIHSIDSRNSIIQFDLLPRHVVQVHPHQWHFSTQPTPSTVTDSGDHLDAPTLAKQLVDKHLDLSQGLVTRLLNFSVLPLYRFITPNISSSSSPPPSLSRTSTIWLDRSDSFDWISPSLESESPLVHSYHQPTSTQEGGGVSSFSSRDNTLAKVLTNMFGSYLRLFLYVIGLGSVFLFSLLYLYRVSQYHHMGLGGQVGYNNPANLTTYTGPGGGDFDQDMNFYNNTSTGTTSSGVSLSHAD